LSPQDKEIVWRLFFSLTGVIVGINAVIWWQISLAKKEIIKRIEAMDARIRQQIDSYGATVGEAVDYLDQKNKEK